MTSTPKLDTIQAKINALKARKAALETKDKQHTKSDRMKRSRTLIQMGGLLSLSQIPKWFDIESGDDLQVDLTKKDQGLMLLGLFLTIAEQMPTSFSEDRKTELKLKGLRFMKENER